jgi:hypothetical protein
MNDKMKLILVILGTENFSSIACAAKKHWFDPQFSVSDAFVVLNFGTASQQKHGRCKSSVHS